MLPHKVKRLLADHDELHFNREQISVLGKKVENLQKTSASFASSYDLFVARPAPSEFEFTIDEDSFRPLDYSSIAQARARDPFLLPDPRNREDYFPESDPHYWLSGYLDYIDLQSLAQKYEIKGGRYFDFGGSSGRVFRNFLTQTKMWEVWSSDFKLSSVEFNHRYFPDTAKCFPNSSFPSLPLPDSYFNLLSAFSVFTHIDESESNWLLELRRILAIGGLAYITVHNEQSWRSKHPALWDSVKRFRPDIADLPELPSGKTVVKWRDDDPYNCNTFHSEDYIKLHWSRYFEILEIVPAFQGWAPSDAQAAVVCRRIS